MSGIVLRKQKKWPGPVLALRCFSSLPNYRHVKMVRSSCITITLNRTMRVEKHVIVLGWGALIRDEQYNRPVL